jgi:zinc/manganese transport system permease protein
VNLGDYLALPSVQHALVAATFIAVACGVISTFVITRSMAFAVHGTAELAFTGAAAGLLIANNAIGGALAGSIVVATLLGVLGTRERDRDATTGVVLAAGLALGVLLLSHYQGPSSEATDILFGNVFGVSTNQLFLLALISVGVLVVLATIGRPLMFASVDADVARAKGVPVRLLGLIFLYVLALTVTEAAQIVGTLLVLSLAITPAAAAQRLATGPVRVTLLAVLFAVVAAVGGIVVSLESSTPPTVFVSAISFAIYFVARLIGPTRGRRGASVTAPA